METEKIISTLKEKLGETSLSDRTIGDYVKNVLLPEGTEPDATYFERHANILKSLNGNYSHDLASKVEEFKKNYKADPPKPDGVIVPKPEESDKRYDELMEKYTKMEERLNVKEKAERQQEYKKALSEQFQSTIKEKQLVYDPVYYKAIELEMGDVDTGKDVAVVVGEIVPKYEKMFSDNNRNGAIPFMGVGGGTAGGNSKKLDDFFAQKAEEEGWAKK